MTASPIAIILARGGSKGVPGKNTADIAGRPAIEWTIMAAREALPASAIVVSSDSAAAIGIAQRCGVRWIERPAVLATDTARVDDAARHAVLELEARGELRNERSTPIVILYANVPVRPAGLIARAVDRLVTGGADSVQSYCGVGKYHPWWMTRVDPTSGEVVPWEGPVLNHGVYRRQDLPPAFVPDGGVLVVTRRALFGEIPGVADGPHAFFGLRRLGVINAEGAVIDIDAPEDLAIARERLSQAVEVHQ